MRYTHLRASLMIIVVQLQVPFASLLAWVIPWYKTMTLRYAADSHFAHCVKASIRI